MYSKADVLAAKQRLHDLLDEKDKLVERSAFIPQELWEQIEVAYVQAVYVQQRYAPELSEYSLNKRDV